MASVAEAGLELPVLLCAPLGPTLGTPVYQQSPRQPAHQLREQPRGQLKWEVRAVTQERAGLCPLPLDPLLCSSHWPHWPAAHSPGPEGSQAVKKAPLGNAWARRCRRPFPSHRDSRWRAYQARHRWPGHSTRSATHHSPPCHPGKHSEMWVLRGGAALFSDCCCLPCSAPQSLRTLVSPSASLGDSLAGGLCGPISEIM